MRGNTTTIRRLKGMAAALAVTSIGSLFMQQANAGCLDFRMAEKKVSSWQTPGEFYSSAKVVKVDYLKVSEEEYHPSFFHAPIVGLWYFKYISEGNAAKPFPINIPDGTVIDGGNTVWYADGNEITYSGMRDPTTGATCLGIWKQTGENSYELNHIGLSWNPPGNPMNAPVGSGGPAFIKQYVTLAKNHDSYTGTFTIRQLLPDGKTLATPAPITGKIVATRVFIDTDTQIP